ncbi:MAG: DUF1538 domain-containing protein [Clostridia bacterium]|nr:DUF1538 domain-containing protein [Clostridia bacterium]
MQFRGLFSKFKESFFSVMPITLIIFALILFFIPTDIDEVLKLLISSVLMIFGVSFFSLGADNSMIELGTGVGATLSKKNKLLFMLTTGFIIGFAITVAEPDLMVLAKQVADSTSLSSQWIFILTISLGVGILFVLGILRIVFNMRLSILLNICYLTVFVLSFFVPKNFVPIAFDSGSVTTGAISVPFLISFGLGLSAVRSKRSEDDSFGLIALCSVGPIIAVMILSLFLGNANITVGTEVISNSSISEQLISTLLNSFKDVAIILIPIVLMFIIFQAFAFKFPKTKVVRTFIGFFLTYIGISLFLTGVVCGYYPLGKEIGQYISSLDFNWVALPLGFILGAFAIIAEPAMQVLKKQVEDITNKAIKKNIIMIFISLGVALSVVVSVLQAMFNFNFLYIIIPILACSLILTFVNPKLFSAIAFDSGGVASGTMAVSFILPFVTGLSANGNGFGTVALIASFPIFTMQIMGLIYKIKLKKENRLKANLPFANNDIIEFDYEQPYVKKQISLEIVEFDS